MYVDSRGDNVLSKMFDDVSFKQNVELSYN